MKTQLGPTDIFFPIPAALIVSSTEETANIMTIAWIGMVSSTPPTIGISMTKSRYSLELINESKEFTVNIPSAKDFQKVDYCGIISGRKHDKFQEASLTPISSSKLKTPIIKECPYNMECTVTQTIELGEFILILGEVIETHIDTDKISNEIDKEQIDIAKINPLVYCATVREYWRLGEKLGPAFSTTSNNFLEL